MSVHTNTYPKNVKIPFSEGEEDRFMRFLEETGRKIGPYLRVLAMEAVSKHEERKTEDGLSA